MGGSFDDMVIAAFRGKTAEQLLEASPPALSGVSASDARHLDDAFGITSIGGLASNAFFERARAIRAAAGTPAFDPGPPAEWEAFFAGAPLDHYVNHPSGRFRLAFGPVHYRGRLDGTARVIVVGQDPATNEILAHRIFVGRSGQRVQGVLARLGITRSYSMVNAFLFSVFGQFDGPLKAISLEAPILAYRNGHLDRLAAANPIEAVVTFGAGAKHAVQNWPGAESLPVFHLTHPAADDGLVVDSWNANLPGLLSAVEPDEGGEQDPTPYEAPLGAADVVPIPRFDLPFGIPDWHGVDGGHATRDGDDRIVWIAP